MASLTGGSSFYRVRTEHACGSRLCALGCCGLHRGGTQMLRVILGFIAPTTPLRITCGYIGNKVNSKEKWKRWVPRALLAVGDPRSGLCQAAAAAPPDYRQHSTLSSCHPLPKANSNPKSEIRNPCAEGLHPGTLSSWNVRCTVRLPAPESRVFTPPRQHKAICTLSQLPSAALLCPHSERSLR